MANLSLKHIYKVYPNGAKAVNDFNMQISDKEFIVFVGPSGCGKSTTLRMIAGLEAITAGELKIGDMVVNGMEPKDRDIAMVFQNYALYPHMTIFENLAFGLRMRKIPDIKKDKEGNPILNKKGKEIPIMRHYNKKELAEKVNEAAEILEISEYLKRKPKEMSGGQRQRVALGRAIVRKPKVMLLDEPLSNLDAKLRTQMRSEIVKLHKKLQTTFIYVTHDQVEAMTMGTRIVVMKDGFVKQIDTPKNLYKYPANKFVAGFIGTPQMNFFEGTLTKIKDMVQIKFMYSDAEITVPYSMLMKTLPEYLDGTKVVYIGFRAEAISLDEEKVKTSKTKIKVRISHSEELGTETLVYGDINMEGDGFAETSTRVIIKSAGFNAYEPDTICEAALDIQGIHLFDKTTEESIMPRVPKYNNLDCTIKDKELNFLGKTVTLPEAISCESGKGELILPVNAVHFHGDIPAEVVDNENINGQILISLDLNGSRVYALSDQPQKKGEVGIGIDFKKIIVKVGGTEIQPMPDMNGLEGTFVMEKILETVVKKEKERRERVAHYYLQIEGVKLEAPASVYELMFAATSGRKVYNSTFKYEWSLYDFTISNTGIAAEALEMLDYGTEKFLRCQIGDTMVYVKTDREYRGKIHLLPDVSKVSVIESERQIRIV
ncbi:MAG: ATP-binding cassette domain-containing protein [Anaeroplasmataceae bacterium]|jgi:ABC-type sugar transport systems, ATPase components|nr:ATP-binding cassette domain-containing protein [Anaeroplasmataceae bacterium]